MPKPDEIREEEGWNPAARPRLKLRPSYLRAHRRRYFLLRCRMDWQANFLALGQLLAEAPTDLDGPGPLSPDTHRWLGRASMLIDAQVKSAGGVDATLVYDQVAFNSSVNNLHGVLRAHNAHEIVAILHRALARAEMEAPATARGGFIGVGAAFDAVQAMSKVLKQSANDVLIVDPYAEATVLTDFAPLAPERVVIRVLADPSPGEIALAETDSGAVGEAIRSPAAVGCSALSPAPAP